jgi:hypothetical protein
MMKNAILSLVMLFFTTCILGQSKKDQISILNQRVDSLINIISKQNNTINLLNSEIFGLKESFSTKNTQLEQKEFLITKLAKTNDSLLVVLYDQYIHCETEWTNLSKGEKIRNFSFNEDFTLSYNSILIKGVVIREDATSISISPISFDNHWVIVHTYQHYMEEWEQPGFFICDLVGNKAYTIKPGCPLLWLSWSPNLTNVLYGSYWEGDMRIYNTNLKTLKEYELEFPADIVKDAQGYLLEELSIKEESVKWISKDSFEILVNINCHPFTQDDCDDNKRNIITRSYTFTYNVTTNKFENKKLN